MDDAGEFFDPFARVWEARMERLEDDPLVDDVAFYRDLASEADGPALEVGVGTGRVYLELLAAGVDADGIDVSPAMLERCRANADERGLDATVWEADVTELDPDREYGLVYAPSRAFNHLPTLADQRAALESIRDVLGSDGRFALNTFVPGFDFVAEQYGEERVEHVTVDGTEYRHVTVSTLDDEVEQVATLRKELYVAETDELVAERETPLTLVPKRQFELLFELAGFSEWEVQGGFDGEPLETADQEMVWVAER
jgi:SAM-dependent methyltransferase